MSYLNYSARVLQQAQQANVVASGIADLAQILAVMVDKLDDLGETLKDIDKNIEKLSKKKKKKDD